MKTLLSIFVLILTSTFSYAADSVYFGEVGFGGTGCKPGETSVRLSSSRRVLRLQFQEYVVESTGRLDRKSCGVAIPVHVPKGLQVSVVPVELSGFAAVGADSLGQINVESFFVGQKAEMIAHDLSAHSGHFNVRSHGASGAEGWSECGKDTFLRVNTSALTKAGGEDSWSQVAVTSAALFQIRTQKCHESLN